MENNDKGIFPEFGENRGNDTGGGKPSVMSPRNKTILIAAILIIVIALSTVCGVFIGKSTSALSNDLPMLEEVYKTIRDNYYEDLSYEQFEILASASISQLLDPFSGLIYAQEQPEMKIGVNIRISVYNEYFIRSVSVNSPAHGKLLRGDEITKVNGKRVRNVSLATFQQYDSDPGKVSFTVERKNGDGVEEYTYVFNKTFIVEEPQAYFSKVSDDIGYIRLLSFDMADDDFAQAMYDFLKSGCKKLIFDLRDNGGGSTSVLSPIMRYFIPNDISDSEALVLALKGKKQDMNFYAESKYYEVYDTQNDGYMPFSNNYICGDEDFKVAILFNENTASASEAFIGNILHYLPESKYVLIGEADTYGKGVAQQDFRINENNAYVLHLTVGYFYVYDKGSKNLVCKHGEGYKPQFYVDHELKANELQEAAVVKAIEQLA